MIWRQVRSEACVRDNRMATGHGYLATCVCASPSEKSITSTLSRPGSDGHPIQQSRNAFKTYKCNLQTWQDLKWSYSRLVDCTYVGRMQKIRPRIEFYLRKNWDPCNNGSLFIASTKITWAVTPLQRIRCLQFAFGKSTVCTAANKADLALCEAHVLPHGKRCRESHAVKLQILTHCKRCSRLSVSFKLRLFYLLVFSFS
jgi:hypothetical protein